ncbi:unnamed protein product [Moneuplotes crassus]|uniref:Uncharacterized protein n=1 Tax=Euplotes crassus TaxID=5936 RepID=A0AAD1X9L9_EUPCR|nr:unnamed protein product [Moneuplotes crassus]
MEDSIARSRILKFITVPTFEPLSKRENYMVSLRKKRFQKRSFQKRKIYLGKKEEEKNLHKNMIYHFIAKLKGLYDEENDIFTTDEEIGDTVEDLFSLIGEILYQFDQLIEDIIDYDNPNMTRYYLDFHFNVLREFCVIFSLMSAVNNCAIDFLYPKTFLFDEVEMSQFESTLNKIFKYFPKTMSPLWDYLYCIINNLLVDCPKKSKLYLKEIVRNTDIEKLPYKPAILQTLKFYSILIRIDASENYLQGVQEGIYFCLSIEDSEILTQTMKIISDIPRRTHDSNKNNHLLVEKLIKLLNKYNECSPLAEKQQVLDLLKALNHLANRENADLIIGLKTTCEKYGEVVYKECEKILCKIGYYE